MAVKLLKCDENQTNHLGCFNALTGRLKPHSNRLIATLATDGWAVYLVQQGVAWNRLWPTQSPPRCTKCNSPPVNSHCTNFTLFDVTYN